MTYNKWIKEYKPRKNPRGIESEFAGYMFETHEEDRDVIFGTPNNHVWTLIDGEGVKLYIIPGRHFVNRLGYFITELPWKDEDESIAV